ncbi:MAG: ABC transporter permease [Acetobacteraceae bacterium]
MRQWLRAVADAEATGPTAVFVGLLIVVIILKGGHYGMFEAETLASNVLPLALVGLGQYFVILVRGIDLSLGPIMSVSSSLAAVLFPVIGVAPAIACAVASGVVAGAGNGILVARLKLSPIIVTLATMSVWEGVSLVVLPTPGGTIPPGLQAWLTSGTLILPVPILLLILTALAGAWIMSTRLGLHLRAIGGDEAAAEASGVAVGRRQFAAYVLGGLLAALGGLYSAIATSAGSPIIGDGYILSSIAAVVLGGVPLIGGRGSPVGVVMGALTLNIIGSLLYFADLSDFYQSLINGVILVAVVGMAAAREWVWKAVAG